MKDSAGIAAGLLILMTGMAWGQTKPSPTTAPKPQAPVQSAFNPRETFAPIAFPEGVNLYRSGDGSPGPVYWQNRADYDISVILDPVDKTLTGHETITYANLSPSQLDCLWVQLDQNIYRSEARSAVLFGRYRKPTDVTDGYVIDKVEIARDGAFVAAPYLVSDTRMRVALDHPLPGLGAKIKLRIAYHYVMPGLFGGRTAWVDTPGGPIFDLAQWYPRMAVFDDVRGWDTLPYIAQEFYLEYGDFDYAVTVPASMMVIGDGDLVNPTDVLTPDQRARLAKARTSDATVMIRTPEEVKADAAAPTPKGMRTWRYHMANTRDVAFTASRAFVWDAARINLPGGRTSLSESVYPLESAGPDAWGRSTEYMKNAVENFSKRWSVYPYSTAVSVAGGAAGIEYPGLVFDGISDKGKLLFWITAHEIGHTWFPMTVGSDERRNAWMDEGINTFIDTYESDDFAGGVYGPKRDSEYAQGGGNPVDEILSLLADPAAPPIMTRADLISERYRHPVTYFKAALGLRLLREEILGPERFDAAFRKYIADWSFKHPKPSDFFREMDSESGEDLAWWWRGWFFENWQLDLAVTGVSYVDGAPAKGARITVETLDKLVMPTVVEVRYVGGVVKRVPVPVEAWQLGAKATLSLVGGPAILSVTIDPDHKLPDRDRANNSFKVAAP
jgi:hypothetical protein